MSNVFMNKILGNIENGKGEKIAFSYIENKTIIEKITYLELYESMIKYRDYFKSLNLENRVCVLYLKASVYFIPILFGCIEAGIKPIIKTIGESVSKYKLFDKLNELKNSMKFIDTVITNYNYPSFDNYCLNLKLNYVDLENMKSSVIFNDKKSIKIDGDIILLTSGSTKASKGVMIELKQLESNVQLCQKLWKINENDVCLNWMPHSHIYGLVTGYLLPIYTCSTSYIMNPKEFSNHFDYYFESLSTFKITHTHTPASNLFLEKGIELIPKLCDDFNLQNLKTVSLGGEAINFALLGKFITKFNKYNLLKNVFSPNYGMSEISGLLTAIRLNEEIHVVNVDNYDLKFNNKITITNKFNGCNLVSVGKVDKNETIIVEPNSLNKLANREIGEIILSVPSLSDGYISSEDNESFIMKNGRRYYKTGDLGFLDDDYLIVTGRLKEIIKIKGKNISPYEIENCINLSILGEKINNIVAFSKKDDIHKFEEIGIFIEPKNSNLDNTKTKEYIANQLNSKLQIKVNKENIVILNKNKIPRFSNGKISRKKCNEYFYKIKEDENGKS